MPQLTCANCSVVFERQQKNITSNILKGRKAFFLPVQNVLQAGTIKTPQTRNNVPVSLSNGYK